MNPEIFLWIGGILVAAVIALGVFLTISGQRSAEDARLEAFAEKGIPLDQQMSTRGSIVSEWLTRRVEKSSWSEKISKDLAQADMKMKPGEYILVMIASCIVVAAFAWFLGSRSILLAVIGAVIGLFLPRIFIRSQRNRRLIKFNNQLGDMLSLMVNGLRAGYSTMQAMEAIAKEMPQPISEEFRRVVQEASLGVTTEKALDNLLRRIPSEDLDLVITAIKVQREVGGNLAEILDTISHTIRERVRVKGEIRVLTAQMKFSAQFLAFLPSFLFLAIYIINKDYLLILIDKEANTPLPCGYIAIVVAVLLSIIGYFVMNQFTKIDV